MNLMKFIDDFLDNRGLEEPNGQRLFEYHIQDGEYSELRRKLRKLGDPKHLSHLRQQVNRYSEVVGNEDVGDKPDLDEKALQTMVAFVLYGAGWFSRHEPSPKRTWGRLFGDIGWDIGWPARNYPELYSAMVRGLKWWGTSVIRTPSKTLYFDTLAYQGGWSMRGLLVVEFLLDSESEFEAWYKPINAPKGFQADGIRVERRRKGPALSRITATFDVGWS